MKDKKKLVGTLLSVVFGMFLEKITDILLTQHLVVILLLLGLLYARYMIKDRFLEIKEKFFLFIDAGLLSIKVHEVNGCFGREKVIREIYEYHMSTTKKKCLLLCGFGGSGKSAIATNYYSMLQCNANILVFDKRKIRDLNREMIQSNTIIFIDYALEAIEDIVSLYEEIKKSNKRRITFVLVERRETKQYCISKGIEFDKVIDLNDSQNLLDDVAMKKIITFNVKNNYDEQERIYKKSGIEISNEKIEEMIKLIKDKIDPDYKRPIFFVIVAEIYKTNSRVVFSQMEGISLLFEEYWNIITRKQRVENFIRELEIDRRFSDIDTKEVEELSNEMRSRMGAIATVGSMLSLEFEINLFGVNAIRMEVFQEKERVTEQYEDIVEVICSFLQAGRVNICARFFQEYGLIDFGRNNKIGAIKYDLVSNWLFIQAINDQLGRELIEKVFEKVSHHSKLMHTLFNYSIRAADEMFPPILNYFMKKMEFERYDEIDFLKDIEICISQMKKTEKKQIKKYAMYKDALEKLLEGLEKLNLGEKKEYIWESIFALVKDDYDSKVYGDLISLEEELNKNDSTKKREM